MATQYSTLPCARIGGCGAEAETPYLQVYVELDDAPYAYGEVIDRDRIIEYSSDGTPIGVEFLHVAGCVDLSSIPQPAAVAEALRAHDIGICA
jgi:hypothetical protein